MKKAISECDWRQHAEHKDFLISETGRVMSCKRGGRRELRPGINSRGYPSVVLDGKSKCVHRLVAETHIPNPNNYREINHIDGDKRNNHVSNLEWCTRSHNIKHAYDNNLRDSSGSVRVCGRPVRIIETGETFRSISECARHLGVHESQVACCLSEKMTQHHSCRGYHFEFIDGGVAR